MRNPVAWLASVLAMIKGGARHVAVATDHVIESFRNGLWPGYKTSAGIEPDLLAQFHPLEEALSALGIVVWPMVEFEADDALAAAAAKAALDPRVERVIICTPDKDLAQCVRGTCVVQMNRRTRAVFDEAGVMAKFGVPPTSIPDYLALVGDAADGYPGLSGWGAKSTAAVLAKYGHLESIPEDWRTLGVNAASPGSLALTLAASATAPFSSGISRRCAPSCRCSTLSTSCTGTVLRPHSSRSRRNSVVSGMSLPNYARAAPMSRHADRDRMLAVSGTQSVRTVH